MISVAHNDVHTLFLQALRQRAKPNLVGPGKQLGIVLEKAIVVMRCYVWRIEIHEVTPRRSCGSEFEVTAHNRSPCQVLRSLPQSLFWTNSDRAILTEGHIEFSPKIHSVKPVPCDLVQ